MITSPSAYARLVGDILGLIATEDTERLVPELLALAEMVDDHWGWEGRKVVDAVRAADGNFQVALVHCLAARYHELEPGTATRRRIVHLLHNFQDTELVEGQPRDTRAARRCCSPRTRRSPTRPS
ncbi:hypothetical protein [Streptomyces sp. NBC_00996]|uniref:hypothetical protein n=1 Tax=Streptomyces sp. NBC_00996 TaxID=2903710 RepID=UPI003862F76E|nr:hypothetical protein OG390_32215 [Streptomyces sp. NBC_00996]